MPIEPPDLVARLERIEGLLVAALGAEGTGAFERLLVQLSQRKGLSPEERDILNKLRSGYRTYGPYLFRSHYPELFSLPSGFGEEIRETRALAQRTSDTYESLSSTVSRMVQDFESFKETIPREFSDLSQELHHLRITDSLGLDQALVRVPRFIPVRVYASNERRARPIISALERFTEEIGFHFSDQFPEERGSVFQGWFAKSKEIATQPEVKKRLEKAERALQLAAVDKQQSEIDKNQAEAAACLINATKDTSSCVMQIGSVLYVKRTIDGEANICARTLTPAEMIHLENNQSLLKKPGEILDALQAASGKANIRRRKLDL